MKVNRINKLKILKIIYLLTAKFDEIEELRTLQMTIGNMSPRSFYAANKKIKILQKLGNQYVSMLIKMHEEAIDIIDNVSRVSSRSFNM